MAGQAENVNGSYVHIARAPQPANETRAYFAPTLRVNGTTFGLGAAHYGGAIYATDMDDFNMTTYDTRFGNNRADVNGGAIYLDGLDKYNILIDKTYM